MSEIMAYQIRPHGLGIIITQMSFLLAMGRPVTAVVINRDNLIYRFKSIFQISDSSLIIETGTHGHPDLETDELCTYAPYFHAQELSLFGRTHTTDRKTKACVAMAMHHGKGLHDPTEQQGMPYNKFATREQYDALFQHLTNLGYDVITMNQPGMDIEQKIYLLNELCDFVIGYEGGLGHLAHVLQIPFLCLPWRSNDMGHPGQQPGLWLEAQRFHPDRRTWFLRDADELVSWDATEIRRRIDRLYQGHGNNILFDPDTVMDPSTLTITGKNGLDLTPRIMWCETRGQHATAFIKEHLPIKNMVQYPLKTQVSAR